MNKRMQVLVIAAVTLLLAGCGVRTAGRVPTPALPKAYAAGRQDAAVQADKADLAEWWKTFHDPLLDSLVERAVAGNLDLRIAQERVREARATRSYTSATGGCRTPG